MRPINEMNEKQLIALIDRAINEFEGQANDLEGAIGTLMLGRRLGWRPLFLMHDPKKIKRFERILEIDFQKDLLEEGDKANKSVAWKAVKKVTNFWKAVTGNIAGVRSNVIAKG
jgi:hypothetical protein